MSFIQKSSISLDFYNDDYKSGLEDYYLPRKQLKYTALPLDCVQMCMKEHERYPILIFCDNLPVGFFVLHGWKGVKEYSDNRDAILLRAFSVNMAFQGKGIATQSLQLLPSFVKEYFPNKSEIILAVNNRNKRAQYVYKKCGFQDYGELVKGKMGKLFIFHFAL